MTESNELFSYFVDQFKSAVQMDPAGVPAIVDMNKAYQVVAQMRELVDEPVWENIVELVGPEYGPVFPQLQSRFERYQSKEPLCFVGEWPVMEFPRFTK